MASSSKPPDGHRQNGPRLQAAAQKDATAPAAAAQATPEAETAVTAPGQSCSMAAQPMVRQVLSRRPVPKQRAQAALSRLHLSPSVVPPLLPSSCTNALVSTCSRRSRSKLARCFRNREKLAFNWSVPSEGTMSDSSVLLRWVTERGEATDTVGETADKFADQVGDAGDGSGSGAGAGTCEVASLPMALTASIAPATAMLMGSSMPMASFEASRPLTLPRNNATRAFLPMPCAENSTSSQRLVTGLRIATARKAAEATTDIGPSCSGAKKGITACSASPTTAPSVAPIATEGVNVPPAAPAPMDIAVMIPFRNNSKTKTPVVRALWIATSANARPFPRRLGNLCDMMPRAKKTVGMATRILQSRRPSGFASSQPLASYVSSLGPSVASKRTATSSSVFRMTSTSRRSGSPADRASSHTLWPSCTSSKGTCKRDCGLNSSIDFTPFRKQRAQVPASGPMRAPHTSKANGGHS
mmetsp:Transcript_67730/g.187812  ORF Transcript_67730/g.187812 Transcript_67730/m.187812 type:complete len:471 (+) Transcript_67730:412-1824(+)